MASTRVRGLTIEINADMTGFAKTLKQQDKNIKAFNTELRDINKILNSMDWGFKAKDSGAIDLLIQKEEKLHSLYDETKKKVENIKAALNKLEEEDPGNIEAMDAYQRELMVTQGKLEQLEQELKDFGSVSKQVWLERFSEIEEYGEKIKAAGDKMTNVGRNLTFKVSQPIYNAGRDMVEAAADFEMSMAKVEAVTQTASKQQIQDLSDLALQMSTTTKYSATEAADALYYMGLAGWDVDQMAKALPDVLALAAAGDMDLAKASDIVTDYTTAFGLSAEQVTYFVDVMAQTMANSNTDVEQLGQAFKYVAPVAGALGFNVEDVSFALGLMANNGIKASQAGTSLRQFMQRLAKPTGEVKKAMEELGLSLEDEYGNAYSFKEILDQLRSQLNFTGMSSEELASQISLLDDALENGELSEEEYGKAMEDLMVSAAGVTGAEKAKNAAILAGTRGLSGLLAIVNTTEEEYNSLADTIKSSNGAAQEMADIMLDTAEGSWLKFKRSVEEVSISLGQTLMPHLMKMMSKVQELVKWFKQLSPETKEMVLKIGMITAAAGPLIIVLGSITSGLGSIIQAVGAIGGLLVSNPLGAVVAALAVAAGGLVALGVDAKNKAVEAVEDIYGLGEAEQALVDKISEMKEDYDEMLSARDAQNAAIETETTKLQTLWQSLDEITTGNGTVLDGYKARAEYITNELAEALGIEIQLNDGIVSKYDEIAEAIQKTIEKKRQDAIINAYQDDYEQALVGVSDAQHDMLLAQDALEAQTQKTAEAQAKYDAVLKQALASDNPDIYASQLYNLGAQLSYAKSEQEKLSESYEDAKEVYSGYMTTIENYEGVLTAVATGDVTSLNAAITKLTRNFKTATTATQEELQAQYYAYKNEYDAIIRAVEDGSATVEQSQLDALEKLVADAKRELNKSTEEYKKGGEASGKAYAEGMESQNGLVRKKGQELGEAGLIGVSSVSTKDIGKNFVLGFVNGIEDNISLATSAAARLANKTADKVHYVLSEHSPSKVMEEAGQYFSEGFAIGIDKDAYLAVNAANDLANRTMNAMNPYVEGNAGASYSNSINVTINGANIQNDAELADLVADRINREVLRRRAVYA